MIRPFGGLLAALRSGGVIQTVLRDFSPDAAIIYNAGLSEYFAVKALRRALKPIPILLELEDLPLARKREWKNLKPRLDQLCFNGMLKAATAFTAVNQAMLDRLPQDKPKVLFPGIIDPVLVEFARNRVAPFSRPKRTLGYFGGLSERKGVGVLLELVQHLPDGWDILVTGSGDMAAQFSAFSRRYPDRLRFLGRVGDRELCQAICSADCMVIPREGIMTPGEDIFPFKTFEYIVSGSHIIGCDLPSACDIDLSFIKGFDGTVSDLVTALSTADTDWRSGRQLRERAISVLLAKYGTESVAGILTDLLFRSDSVLRAGRWNSLALKTQGHSRTSIPRPGAAAESDRESTI